MNDKLISITVTYDSGRSEQFPQELVNTLAMHQGDHTTIFGFIQELFNQWNLDYQLSLQQDKHDEEIENLQNIQRQTLQNMETKYKKDHDDSSNSQRATLKGQNLEKWFPCLSEFPYANGDVIAVYDVFDLLTLVGHSNHTLNGITFQELKTGVHADRLSDSQLELQEFIEYINHPLIHFEHWAMEEGENIFHLIKNKKQSSVKRANLVEPMQIPSIQPIKTSVDTSISNTVKESNTSEPNMQSFYTTEDVAQQLHCSNDSVRRYITTGKLKASNATGRWLICKPDIESFLDSCTNNGGRNE